MRPLIAFLLCGTLLGGEWWGEWDRSTNTVNGYLVRYGPSSNNKLVNQFVGDTNKVGILNIPDNIEVFFEVLAVGTNGVLSWPSNEYVVTTNRVSAPTNLRSVTNVSRYELIMTNIVHWQEIKP